jgi:hypothetical protein
VRYANFQANRLVLWPQRIGFPVGVVEPGGGETANDLLVGRVALILNQG